MSYPTINRQEVIDVFHRLMQPGSQFQVLRLLGDSKQGKSHLVTKVFPWLAQEFYQARCAVLDLRNQAQSVPDILHNACSLLSSDTLFPAYYAAHHEWINRPIMSVTNLYAFLSRVQIKSEGEAGASQKMIRHLTTQFVTDLRNVDASLLFLFDQLDNAKETTQGWLMDHLLVQLAPLAHVRVVLAGRFMPEASGSYAPICDSYELLPVREEEAYIAYCRQIGATLVDQSIRDFVRAFDYKPGLFVDYVRPTFSPVESSHG